MVAPTVSPTPPSEPAWDLTFTRLAQAARSQVDRCANELVRRFQVMGLECDLRRSQTPRGLTTFLALMGQRGLVCIVDLTLVDGMAVGQGPSAALDMRLLDACGDVVIERLAHVQAGDLRRLDASAGCGTEVFSSDILAQAVTGVYVATLAQFDLLGPTAKLPRLG